MTTPGKRTFTRITYPIFVSVYECVCVSVNAVPSLMTLRSPGRSSFNREKARCQFSHIEKDSFDKNYSSKFESCLSLNANIACTTLTIFQELKKKYPI